MGLVASQARMLLLFGRKSDIEFRCQTISNKRMRLSFETGEIAKTYADALSNTTPMVVQPATNTSTAFAPTNYTPATTTQAVSLDELHNANLQPYYSNNNLPAYWLSPAEMGTGLNNGTLYLKNMFTFNGEDPDAIIAWNGSINGQEAGSIVQTNVAWPTPPEQPAASQGMSTLYTEDDAQATAIYEAQSTILQAEDKRLELELKNLETQHKAISTEIDAVQKVIEKNIEKSFKTLG